MRLDVLRPATAMALLAEWAGRPVSSLPAAAREVAEEAGFLLLSLALAGGAGPGRPNVDRRASRTSCGTPRLPESPVRERFRVHRDQRRGVG